MAIAIVPSALAKVPIWVEDKFSGDSAPLSPESPRAYELRRSA